MLVGFQEGFLEHILSVLPILGDVLGQAENLAFIPAHQFPEGGGIPLAGLG
jgi:hypothetical protein